MESPQRKTVLHLSDLHFGRLQEDVVDKLLEFIHQPDHDKVDLVVLSGDLTQRARTDQFVAAAEFLKKVKLPVMAVPGNHDVPLYDVITRFFRPFKKFNQHISPLAAHFFEDREIFIHGLKTNNIFRVAEGRVSKSEVEILEKHAESANAKDKFRIIVCHHPIFEKLGRASKRTQGLLQRILDLKPHLVLFGHDHQSRASWLNETEKLAPVLIGAGTGTSSRLRTEANSVNLITWDPSIQTSTVRVYVFEMDKQSFEMASEKKFQFN